MSAPGVRLALVGDIGLALRVPAMAEAGIADDSSDSFAARLRSADLAFGNLELPFSSGLSQAGTTRALASPADAPLLARLGFDLVSLGNNHIFDAGPDGIETTRRLLDELRIGHVGAGRDLTAALSPTIVERNGHTIGWLAFADGRAGSHRYIATETRAGAAPLDRGLIRHAVAALRPRVDLLCVSFHQGLNYVHYASPRQREFARTASEAGADIIVGHHPHVLQGMERMGRTLVFHSLGEFLWDPEVGSVVEMKWDQARRKTALVEIEWRRDAEPVVNVHPFVRSDAHRLEAVRGEERVVFDAWWREMSDVYADYDPSVFLQAADRGVVEHWFKVARNALKTGNFGYFLGSARRLRGRHLAIAWTHVRRRLGLSAKRR